MACKATGAVPGDREEAAHTHAGYLSACWAVPNAATSKHGVLVTTQEGWVARAQSKGKQQALTGKNLLAARLRGEQHLRRGPVRGAVGHEDQPRLSRQDLDMLRMVH